jgi:hypothetical protein
MTFTAWINQTPRPETNAYQYISLDDYNSNDSHMDLLTANNNKIYVYANGDVSTDGQAHGSTTYNNTFYHVGGVFISNVSRYVYRNGDASPHGTQEIGAIANMDTLSLGCGWYNSTRRNSIDGKIDEARISATTRSTAWILATYNHTYDPDTYVVEGTPGGP